MMPIITTCYITYLFTFCRLENDSIFTAFRSEDNVLTTYIDGELFNTIINGKVQ